MDVHFPRHIPETEPWRVVAETRDYVLASWQQIFAVVWRAETTVQGAEHLHYGCKDFARVHPLGIGLLTIIAANAPLPPGPARRAIAEFLAAGSTFIKCSAVVLEGSGFRAAAVRSVVTGLTLLAKQGFPHRVCDLDDATLMLSRVLTRATGRGVNARALRVSIDDLRQHAQICRYDS